MIAKQSVPIILGISLVVIVWIPYADSAYAQYMGNVGIDGQTGANTLEENIKLATDRVTLANQYPDTGSGTPYFAADGILGAVGIAAGVFGGISLAFFARARHGRYVAPGRG